MTTNENYTDWDFVLVTEEHQKKLNQWRHKYYIRIVGMTQTNSINLSILIARKEIK